MNAEQIIRTVEAAGGLLFVDGDKLRLKAPAGISPELKDAIRTHKDELLEALCRHEMGCPHSLNDLIAEYQRSGKLRIECDGKAVWLVRTEEIAANIKEATVYTVSEWQRVTELTNAEISTLHRVRTIGGPGGQVELR
jgi:hypothetical protein